MDPRPLNVFTETRSPDFWLRNRLQIHRSEVVYQPRLVRHLASGRPESVNMPAQIAQRDVLRYAVQTNTVSNGEDALFVASGNVQSFNQSHPDLPKIDHPSVTRRDPLLPRLRQLTYELKAIEYFDMLVGTEIHRHFPALSPINPRHVRDLNHYVAQAMNHLEADYQRVKKKYARVGHLVRAVHMHIDGARQTMRSDTETRGLLQTLPPAHVRALSRLHQGVKRSVHAARADFNVLEALHARAAVGVMQLKKVDYEPGAFRAAPASYASQRRDNVASEWTDYLIAPMRLPNLFGPGHLLINSAKSAKRMDTLFETVFDRISDLRNNILRPRASELAVINSAATELFRHNSAAPINVEPFAVNRFFERPATHLAD